MRHKINILICWVLGFMCFLWGGSAEELILVLNGSLFLCTGMILESLEK